ncbi:phosphomannomutase/phosphoglucomutase, partial [Candidatus Gracilibacteria bacterium]|nr:phosphomannomutase/phosphoglucomutase [Candidatus Gracilibacteria bacterium]
IIDAGKNVIDIDLCSTDMIYFASGKYDEIDIGLMITASHNPKEYNGLKACFKNAFPINMKETGKEIKKYLVDWKDNKNLKKGTYTKKDISDDFVKHVTSFINIKNIKPLKIVADAGNGVAGVFMEKLANKLGFKLIPIYFEPDGNFPNHHPSPIEKENVQDLIKKVKESGADLGVAFDGDADRMYICDEKGEMWNGTITTAMISKLMLEKNPGKKIVYNAICGNIVPEIIAKNKGIGIKEKVGHVYIKEKMGKDNDVIFGGEHSGHYYFRKNWNADSGVIAFTIILELISKSNKKASDLKKEFEKYFSIDETNFKVSSVEKKLAEIKNIYSSGIQDELDGLTVRFKDFWFNVRPSSNEPLLRLNLEASSESLLKEKTEELLEIIRR